MVTDSYKNQKFLFNNYNEIIPNTETTESVNRV